MLSVVQCYLTTRCRLVMLHVKTVKCPHGIGVSLHQFADLYHGFGAVSHQIHYCVLRLFCAEEIVLFLMFVV